MIVIIMMILVIYDENGREKYGVNYHISRLSAAFDCLILIDCLLFMAFFHCVILILKLLFYICQHFDLDFQALQSFPNRDKDSEQ